MRGFEIVDGKATIPLNCAVQGDVTVILYHARSTFGGKVQGKITSIKICQFQFHTGFVQSNSRNLLLSKHNLDHLDSVDKYPDGFRINLDYVVSQKEYKSKAGSQPWDGLSGKGLNPKLLFVDREEQHLIMSEFGVSERAKRKLGRSGSQSSNDQASTESTPCDSPAHYPSVVTAANNKPPPSRPPPPSTGNQPKNTAAHGTTTTSQPAPHTVGHSTFFDTLDWEQTAKSGGDAQQQQQQQNQNEFDWHGTSTGLMDDISGDEDSDDDSDQYIGGNIKPPVTKPAAGQGQKGQFDDEFADFTAARFTTVNGTNKNQPDIVQSNQAKNTNVEDVMGGFSAMDVRGDTQQETPVITVKDEDSPKEEVVDLLNMGGGGQSNVQSGSRSNSSNNMNLLDMGSPEPSNFDLLSGGNDLLSGTGGTGSAPMSNASSNADLFGDFGSFQQQSDSEGGGKPSAAAQSTNKEKSFDPFQQQSNKTSTAFDGFDFLSGSDNTQNNDETNKTPVNNSQVGGNVDFLSFMEDSTKKVPSSSSDDLMGNWNAGNIPKNNSFSSIPRNSSTGSGLGSMTGAGMTSTGSNPNMKQQQGKVDPFANLSEFFLP